ncbi:MAG: tetratricopeptide repeat protein, partial [Proteobacteria bacterium]|nr:tetratricopeptide repeat protein [Pseudomonadota bacterium]
MNDQEVRQAIEAALTKFTSQPLADAASYLLGVLGYTSNKRLPLKPNTLANFLATFSQGHPFNDRYALPGEWKTVDFLFQLTDDEVRAAGNAQFDFESKGAYNGAVINSYLFFALELKGSHYSRTALAGITREVNKLFDMPALILFRHGETLTLAVINRRLHKREEGKDVLEKVTLIQGIRCTNTHRAHIEILLDLSLGALHDEYRFTNFVELHAAWQKTLDTSALNKRFFQDLANWYYWALQHVRFPQGAGKDADVRNATSVIRLITRLIFVWFIKEKGLVSESLFRRRDVEGLLQSFAPEESTYYKAILQNLFFATLNTEMDVAGKPSQRTFRKRTKQKDGRDQHYMVHNVYRYEDQFRDSKAALKLFANTPFLNGGLFECLDKRTGTGDKPIDVRIDGFSDRDDNPVSVPNFLFFGPEQEVDLNEVYGTKNKHYKALGLVNILNRYKFTVNENTPVEEEVALDPELLGRVFENLLASYNPETSTTARKQTGSFYTPREIVNYMVDEALVAYLESSLAVAAGATASGGKVLNELLALGTGPGDLALSAQEAPPRLKLAPDKGTAEDINQRLRHLLAYNDEPHRFSPAEVRRLIQIIDRMRILDPACGSGAFPMGVLHKLVFLLGRLDPGNKQWKARQIERVDALQREAQSIPDANFRERALADLETQKASIEETFERNELDYGRKLFLIENCIFGVDIQPVAVQIAKLRFFISLIVDQKIDDARENRGVRPLRINPAPSIAWTELGRSYGRSGQTAKAIDALEQALRLDPR